MKKRNQTKLNKLVAEITKDYYEEGCDGNDLNHTLIAVVQKQMIITLVNQCEGNVAAATYYSGLSRPTFIRLMERFRLR